MGGGGPRVGTVTDCVRFADSDNCGAFNLGGSLSGGDVDEVKDGFRAGKLGSFCGGWTASGSFTGTG